RLGCGLERLEHVLAETEDHVHCPACPAERLVTEIERLPVVLRQERKPDHRAAKSGRNELAHRHLVAEAAAHRLSIERYARAVEPEAREGLSRERLDLRNFALVMRKDEV